MRDREDRFAGGAAQAGAALPRRRMGAEMGMPWCAMQGGSRVLRVVVPLAFAVILSACSTDDDAVPPPESTPTSALTPTQEPTASPTAEEPTPEADPTADLEAEITEFFEEYISVSDRSWSSPQALERRREMFADSCEICTSGYQVAEDALSENLVFHGEPGNLVDAVVTAVDGDIFSVLTTIDAPPATLVDSDGNTVHSFEANMGSQVVYQVQRVDGQDWAIIKGDPL